MSKFETRTGRDGPSLRKRFMRNDKDTLVTKLIKAEQLLFNLSETVDDEKTCKEIRDYLNYLYWI